MVNKKSLEITESIVKDIKEQIAAIFEEVYSEKAVISSRKSKPLKKTIMNAINRRLGE